MAQHAPPTNKLRFVVHRTVGRSIKVVVGDQGDLGTLRRWVAESGGGFDFIVDDGGHLSHQQIASFRILFQHALNPGGLYVIEDLQYYL
jgi:hypothetical protein